MNSAIASWHRDVSQDSGFGGFKFESSKGHDRELGKETLSITNLINKSKLNKLKKNTCKNCFLDRVLKLKDVESWS